MKENGLLEIIAAHRTVTDLDEFLKRDKYYQNALEEERSASDIMDSLNFTSEQKKAVDRVITAYNECGAAYGAVAYRFGMEDGDGRDYALPKVLIYCAAYCSLHYLMNSILTHKQ